MRSITAEIVDEEITLQVFVRADLSCGSPIEIPYYSAKYNDICVNCGGMNELELNDELYPLCDVCKRKGVKAQNVEANTLNPKINYSRFRKLKTFLSIFHSTFMFYLYITA